MAGGTIVGTIDHLRIIVTITDMRMSRLCGKSYETATKEVDDTADARL